MAIVRAETLSSAREPAAAHGHWARVRRRGTLEPRDTGSNPAVSTTRLMAMPPQLIWDTWVVVGIVIGAIGAIALCIIIAIWLTHRG